MNRDPIQDLLERLERPVQPGAEFSDALLERLLEELGEQQAHSRRRNRSPLRVPRWIRPQLVAAAALAVVVALFASLILVVTGKGERSALAVVRQAEESFADVPPFDASVFLDRNPEGSTVLGIPRDATATLRLLFGGPTRLREEFVSEQPAGSGEGILGGPGGFLVFDGRTLGQYTATDNSFRTIPERAGFEPLRDVALLDPARFEEQCRADSSQILPDEKVAGRIARHVRCGDPVSGSVELWLDAETGLVLKQSPQTVQDDFHLGTSPKGSLEVTAIDYNPSFGPGDFTVGPPQGAQDVSAQFRAAEAGTPPFEATYTFTLSAEFLAQQEPTYTGGDWVRVYRVWFDGPNAWRNETLRDTRPEVEGADSAGSFEVWNGKMALYYAFDNSYDDLSEIREEYNPLFRLHPALDSNLSNLSACGSVGRETVAGREAVHRTCGLSGGDNVWLDVETGLILKRVASWGGQEITRIEYNPVFPPGTFTFVPPPGARTVEEVLNDPYAQTNLRVGEIAPVWSGQTLEGGTLRLKSLRGQPALILLFSHDCPSPDPSCDVLPTFQQAFQEWSGRLAFVWVDSFDVDASFPGGSLEEQQTKAETLVHRAGYTFPVVLDPDWPISSGWGVRAASAWVLLDPDGKVIEVRIKPQTLDQLNDLFSKATGGT